MPRVLLDSSVIAKWFLTEVGTPEALAIQQAFVDGDLQLYYAELSLFEVANALHYSRLFEPKEIVAALRAINDLEINKIGHNERALARSVELSKQFGIAIYDSYLVALAELLSLDFVSSDGRLLRSVASLTFINDLMLYRW